MIPIEMLFCLNGYQIDLLNTYLKIFHLKGNQVDILIPILSIGKQLSTDGSQDKAAVAKNINGGYHALIASLLHLGYGFHLQ